jgi:hypothetical protein
LTVNSVHSPDARNYENNSLETPFLAAETSNGYKFADKGHFTLPKKKLYKKITLK